MDAVRDIVLSAGTKHDVPLGHLTETECDPSLRQNVTLASIFITLLIVFSFFIEFITHKLESKWGRFSHIMKIINAVYKELMIIGVISFFMFVLKQTTALKKIQELFVKLTDAEGDDNCEELTDILWEKVHMFLFELMVLYILICMYLILLHVLISRYFSSTEKHSHLKWQMKHTAEGLRRENMNWFVWFFNIFSHLRQRYYTSKLNYHVLRDGLIVREKAPEDLTFFLYLKYGMREVIVIMIHIHWTVWLMLLLAVWANWARYLVIDFENMQGAVALILTGVITTTLQLAFYFRCRVVLNRILRNERKSTLAEKERLLDDVEGSSHNHGTKSAFHPNIKALRRFSPKLKLIMFHQPLIYVRMFQAILFLLAVYCAMVSYYTISAREELNWYWRVVFVFIPFLNFAVICPITLAMLVRILYTGTLVRTDLVEKVVQKQKKLTDMRESISLAEDERQVQHGHGFH
jgi:hypothetical protein